MNKAELIEAIKAKGFVALIVDEEAKNADLELLLDQLNAVKGVSEDQEELAKTHEEAIASLTTEHEAKVEELSALLAELNEKLAQVESRPTVKSAGNPVVEVEGKKFEILLGGNINVDGVYGFYSKEKLAESPEVIAHLVSMGSGLVKELED
jgi:ABC-type hemin transport system substrate-binding protein